MSTRQPVSRPTYDFLAPDDSVGAPDESFLQSTFRQSKIPDLRQDPSHDASLIELNAVKYELSTLKEERERDKLRQEQETRDLKQKLHDAGKATEQDKTEKNFLFERQNTLGEELKAAKEETANLKQSYERKLRNLDAKNNTLNEQLIDTQNEINTIERKYKYRCDELETSKIRIQESLDDVQNDLEAQVTALQQCQRKLAERDEEFSSTQAEMRKLKTQGDGKDTQVQLDMLKREMSEQVNHITILESTNRKQASELQHLRDYAKSYSVLEEQNRALEARVPIIDELREQLSNAEIQLSVMREEKLSWASYLQDDQNELQFDSPEHLARTLAQERIEKATLMEKFGRLEPEAAEKDGRIQELEREIAEIEEQFRQTKDELNKDVKSRQRLERQKDLALKEASFLREQLKTYASEEAAMNENADQQKSKRIEELEGLLEEHKKEISSLSTQVMEKEAFAQAASINALKRQREDTSGDHEQAMGQLSRKLRSMQEELNNAERANKLAINEAQSLQKRLAASETTSRMRVLQLKDNPAARHEAIKKELLDGLKRENEALLAQLEGRPGGAKLVPMSTLENCRMDVKEMEKVVAEKEKRMTRLKEMWSRKALEFRQAVYSILGYDVEFQPNGRVKVTSMFHTSDFYGGVDTGIIFDGEQGTMKLCGGLNNQFAREIKNNLEFYVEKRKEIPCFLAALTMEGYEKTTKAGRF